MGAGCWKLLGYKWMLAPGPLEFCGFLSPKNVPGTFASLGMLKNRNGLAWERNRPVGRCWGRIVRNVLEGTRRRDE